PDPADSSNMVTAVGYFPTLLGKDSLPTLASKHDFLHHLSVVEACVVEAGYATAAAEGIKVEPRFQHLVVSRLLNTFALVKDVSATAERAAVIYGYDWQLIRTILVRQYGKKHSLKDEYLAKLSKLRFVPNGDYEAFIEDAADAFALFRRIFGKDTAEHRAFIRQLCRVIPHDTLVAFLKEIRAAIAGAGLEANELDWETTVAFDDFDLATRESGEQPKVTTTTFCAALRGVCGVEEEARRLLAYTGGDTVRYAAAAKPATSRPKFSERFPHVVYVAGAFLEDKAKAAKYLQTFGPEDILCLRSRRGRPFALLGFQVAADAAKAAKKRLRASSIVRGEAHNESDESEYANAHVLILPRHNDVPNTTATATALPPVPTSPLAAPSPVLSPDSVVDDRSAPFFTPTSVRQGESQSVTAGQAKDSTPVDSLCSLNFSGKGPPELKLKVLILPSFEVPPASTTAVLDSGAGYSYLLCPSIERVLSQWHVVAPLLALDQSVQLADGKLCRIRQGITLTLAVLCASGSHAFEAKVPLRILEAVVSTPAILLGRDVIQDWDLRVFGANMVTTAEGTVLFSTDGKMARSSEFVYSVSDLPIIEEPFDSMPTSSIAIQPDPSVIPFEVHLTPALAEKLRGWVAILADEPERVFGTVESGEYRIQLLRLPLDAARDTALQAYFFQLTIPPPVP
ncbi:hypothetical protein FOL47_002377, partial [Perkinsus chesapeaki]